MENNNKLGRINLDEVLFLSCDIQDSFIRNLDKRNEKMLHSAVKLLKFSLLMNIPVLVSRQNKKHFGETLPILSENFHNKVIEYDKQLFSMITPEIDTYLNKNKFKSMVLFGCQTHVCVLHTCLDLLKRGYDVHVCADGVWSPTEIDNDTALKRMENSGAHLSTSATIMYEIIKTNDNPKFIENTRLINLPKLNLKPKF